MKKLLTLFLAIAIIPVFAACSNEGTTTDPANTGDSVSDETTIPENSESNDTSDKATEPETTKVKKKELTFGSTFVFDDLEITIGNAEDVTWDKVDNQFSDKNGADVIVLPVTVKNLKDESHSLNMFYYKFYGSAGTELESVSSYFSDSDIGFAGDMRTGASITSAFHLVYDGDGDYYIEFSGWIASDKIEVKLPITK